MYYAIKSMFPGKDFEVLGSASSERILLGLGLSGTARFSHVILGGGTLINPGYERIVKQTIDMDIPISAFGTGVGSHGFSAKLNVDINAWRELLVGFKHVSVRGPVSLEQLSSFNIPSLEIIGDPALGLTPLEPPSVRTSKCFVLNAAFPQTHTHDFPVDQVQAEMINAIKELVSRDWRPIPVAFASGDRESLQAVLSLASLEQCVIEEPKTYEEFSKLAKNATFTLGVRLHSAVLSCTLGVPPILIGYRGKCYDFMDSMDLADFVIDPKMLECSTVLNRVSKIEQGGLNLSRQIHKTALHWKSIQENLAERLIDDV